MKPAIVILVISIIFFCLSCRTTSRPGLFTRKTPHETYGNKLSDAGLRNTGLGKSWFDAAARAIAQPVSINKPYRETGFFAADQPKATGLRFSAQRGEKLQITVSRKPGGFKLYLDLWQVDTGRLATPKLLASSDTTGIAIEHEVEKTGNYILRLQPELLQDCEYTVDISAVASLAYPIRAPGKNHIKSYWGADRDAGARRHEGVDIFAARRTPVVAAANGHVTRVNETNLGGKVVWLRPNGKDYTLYYAHLDTQFVQDGQEVTVGDTLGLMGNTGNARTTPPHLHFGIYALGGAIDPLPFVNPNYPDAPKISADPALVGKWRRSPKSTSALLQLPDRKASSKVALPRNSLLMVTSAVDGFYRVELPDGVTGFIPENLVSPLEPLRSYELSSGRALLSMPDSLAASKRTLARGNRVSLLAEYGNFEYVQHEQVNGWILRQ